MRNAIRALLLLVGLGACPDGPGGTGPDGSVVPPPDECGWSQLGGVLNHDPDQAARTPAVALDPASDRVAVAWIEESELGGRDLFVKAWQDGAWVALGDALQENADDRAWDPQIAWGPDGILVTWYETVVSGGAPSRVYVKRWDLDQKQWLLLGSQVSHDPSRPASQPALVLDSQGRVIVAWAEHREVAADVYVAAWDGQQWSQLGDALHSPLGEFAAGPFLAIDPTDDQPMIAYLGGPNVAGTYMADSWVAKWSVVDGWLLLAQQGVVEPPWAVVGNRLAVTSKGDPFIATAYDDLSPQINTIVSRFDGADGAWKALGSLDPVERYSSPALVIDPQTDQPVLAADARKLVIKRYDGGTWAPVCVKTGYLGYRSFSPAFAIRPSGDGVVAFVDGERSLDARLYVKQGPLR